jgi:hypothetical protein
VQGVDFADSRFLVFFAPNTNLFSLVATNASSMRSTARNIGLIYQFNLLVYGSIVSILPYIHVIVLHNVFTRAF